MHDSGGTFFVSQVPHYSVALADFIADLSKDISRACIKTAEMWVGICKQFSRIIKKNYKSTAPIASSHPFTQTGNRDDGKGGGVENGGAYFSFRN